MGWKFIAQLPKYPASAKVLAEGVLFSEQNLSGQHLASVGSQAPAGHTLAHLNMAHNVRKASLAAQMFA